MNRAHFMAFTALAAAFAATFVTLSEPADAPLMGEPARAATALASIRLSDDAMALAGVAALLLRN
jgi:hypothetical protein